MLHAMKLPQRILYEIIHEHVIGQNVVGNAKLLDGCSSTWERSLMIWLQKKVPSSHCSGATFFRMLQKYE